MVSKLEIDGERVTVDANDAIALLSSIFCDVACSKNTAQAIAEHLANANLCGVESHGLMRTIQSVEQFNSGYMQPVADVRFVKHPARYE